ncbi:hypothetical protein DRW03_17180 [Corallococcus sp. H22C18031201]|nr:hypothetical protein DRW03_17180 [Corallococcus sp. H22C18031201]
MSGVRTPPPEEEDLRLGRTLALGGAALGVLAASSWVAWLLWCAWRPGVQAPVPSTLGAPQVGRVEQVPFMQAPPEEAVNAREQARLKGYGWVDRDAGLIHIPVERAMEQLVSEESAGGRR